MGQEGVRYQVVVDPKNGEKWGQLVTIHKNEEPLYEESLELKLLNVLKVTHIPMVDDLTQALYMRETKEVKQLFYTKSPPPHKIVKDKVFYIYLRANQIVALTPNFFYKFCILYEPIELRAIQDLT